eukprot:TRINITY_DN43599_c0_g1_i1.p1 TRINITY_DN43599_c0_g1~~TRINITY_DN43599_c0_g1_i1.p1  ORF type:complete len:474 (+),score=191.31 TRINITY_DN43599_c0_g1_i1:73-1494(+)
MPRALPLLLLAGACSAFDFDKYKTCKSCVKVGKGWCPIARRCGNFANDRCDVGERYFQTRELYLVATIKRLKKLKKKGDSDAAEEVEKLKRELKQLREELAEDEDGEMPSGDEVVVVEEDGDEQQKPQKEAKKKKKKRRRRRRRTQEQGGDADAGDDDDSDADALAEVEAEAKRRKEAAKGRKRPPPKIDLLDGYVMPLAPRNFTQAVLDSEEPWIVEFWSPFCGHCKMFAPEYDNAAAKLAGKVRVGAVNADKFGDLASQFGVSGYPSLRLFMADKANPIAAPVPWRMAAADPLTEDAVVSLALKHAAEMPAGSWGKAEEAAAAEPVAEAESCQTAPAHSLPIPLTPRNFSTVLQSDALWMVLFSAPAIGGIPCRACEEFEAEWAHAAKVLRGVVRLGVVDADAHPDLLASYDVGDAVPAARAWLSDDKTAMPKHYTGGRDSASIVDWITQKMQRLFMDRDKKLQRERRFSK